MNIKLDIKLITDFDFSQISPYTWKELLTLIFLMFVPFFLLDLIAMMRFGLDL